MSSGPWAPVKTRRQTHRVSGRRDRCRRRLQVRVSCHLGLVSQEMHFARRWRPCRGHVAIGAPSLLHHRTVPRRNRPACVPQRRRWQSVLQAPEIRSMPLPCRPRPRRGVDRHLASPSPGDDGPDILGALFTHGAADSTLEQALDLPPTVQLLPALRSRTKTRFYAATQRVRPLSLGRLGRG